MGVTSRLVAAFVAAAFALAAEAGPRVVVASFPRSEGACPFFTNAAVKAGFDVSVRNGNAKDWEKADAYKDADVVVFTGGFNDGRFPSKQARLMVTRFAAGGGGVLLTGFRGGPVRNWGRAIFPQIASTYGAHPLTPWISPVGDSSVAKAFAGETLAIAQFDCFGLTVGKDGKPFAKCGDETVGALGEVGLGRVAVLGTFVTTQGMPKRPDLVEAVYAELLRYLSSGKTDDAERAREAVAREERKFAKHDMLYKWTNDERGAINTQGILPEMRDGALVPVESRQFLLEHYARTLDDKLLAEECRALAAKAKDVVDKIRLAGACAICNAHCMIKTPYEFDEASLTAGLREKEKELRETLAATAAKCDIAAIAALLAKCRAKAKEERMARVAAEHKRDLATLPSHIARLASSDETVRLDAATELGRIGAETPEVVAALVRAINDADRKVAVQAVVSLAWMQAKGAVDVLIAKVKDDSCEEHVRRRAAQALGQIGDERAIPALLPLLASRDRWLRENAILSLGYLKAKESVPTLVKYAKGEDIPEHDGKYTRDEKLTVRNTRECALRALGMIGDKSVLQALEEIASDKSNPKPPVNAIATCVGCGVAKLAKSAIADIERGGLSERGVRQPDALSSREFFYALTKGNNALAGRPHWTYMHVPWFKAEKDRRLLLPYLLDAGFTGIHCAWGVGKDFGEKEYERFLAEADELGLIMVETAPTACPGSIYDIAKGSQDWIFTRIGENPLYLGCWSEEDWPHAFAAGKDLDSWLKRKHGDGYAKTLGLKDGQTPLAQSVWKPRGIYKNDEAMGFVPEREKSALEYDPGINSGALRVTALEMVGEDMKERMIEAQDWLRMRRKAFSFTYSVHSGAPAVVLGGQKAMSEVGVVGPESYQACGRGNVFLAERFRNGRARPVMTEFYNMYSPTLAHDLRGFYENAIHAKCFYPFDISHLTPFYGRFLTWGWNKGRWDLFRRVYGHVREHKDLYAVSPSAARVAVVTSERSFVCARRQHGDLASEEESMIQRGSATLAALSMSHICADVLDIDLADAKTLSKYAVIFLVDAKILTEREQEVLREWVSNGGTLVCDGATGLFDAKNLERRDDFAIADLLGVKYVATDFMQGRPVYVFWPETRAKKSIMKITPSLDNPWLFQSYVWRDFKDDGAVAVASGCAQGRTEYDAVLGVSRVELKGAKAVQTFADGSPALTMNEFGNGRACLFASLAPMLGHVASNYESNPNRFDFWPGVRETYEALAREGLSRIGKEQPVDVLNAPDELELTVYEQKGGDRLVVHLLDRDERRDSLDGVSLRINGTRQIKAVHRPGGTPLALSNRMVALGKFAVYDMIVVEFYGGEAALNGY